MASFFLNLVGIIGESKHPKFPNQIEVLSYSLGPVRSLVPGESHANKFPPLNELAIAKRMDKASTVLNQKCLIGDVIPSGTLTVLGEDGIPTSIITMTEICVTSWQLGGMSGDIPSESFVLNFRKITRNFSRPGP